MVYGELGEGKPVRSGEEELVIEAMVMTRVDIGEAAIGCRHGRASRI
jgi:hypothetical protein